MNDLFTAPKSKAQKAKMDVSALAAFVTFIVAQGARVSYDALTHAAAALGVIPTSRLAAAPIVGGALAGSLPIELQPYICRNDGGYKEGTQAKWGKDVPANLSDLPVLRSENAAKAVAKYKEAPAA